MAESFLSDISVELVKMLGSTAVRNLGTWWNYKSELDKLEDTIATIQAVLLDAEEERQPSNQFKLWLRKLKNVLYDAEELVDDFSTEVLRRQVTPGNNFTKEVRVFFSWSSNQFVYGLRMGNKIKEVREALDVIANDRQKFHFTVSSTKAHIGRDEVVSFNRENFKVKGEILGRDDDKRKIIENHLLKADGHMVVSIVGSGGLGKTTLARLIFDDDELKKHFDLRMWVSVGDINFNIDEIVEKAVKSRIEKEEGAQIKRKEEDDRIGDQTNVVEETKKVKRSKSVILDVEGDHKKTFGRLIRNKKFLLVLDDVWSEDRNKWINLEKLWNKFCEKESRVLVTTRSSIVAKMTGNPEPYHLGFLSFKDSYSLFKKIVFGNKETLSQSVQENVRKIVKKCGGVPLAIETIANLLFFKDPETKWLPYVTNEISKYPKANNNIFPTLQLSYQHLPSPLKYCFAYCKIFPKGYKIDVETLIQLWIAQGYIRASNMSNQSLEDIGMQYCEMLLSRSFFQDEELDEFGNVKTVKLHDIMYELTSFIGSEDIVHFDEFGNDVNKNTHHLSYEKELSWSASPQLDSLLEARKLRTFISVENEDTSNSSEHMIENGQCNKMLKKLKSLLVLDLQGSRWKYKKDEELFLRAAITGWAKRDQVLKSIGKLKHLRYLDLSFTNIKELPKSITKLQNLRVLKMVDCYRLRKLRKDIKKLVNLQILDCEGCDELTYMPRGLQNLTSLHTLTDFVVAQDPNPSTKAGIEELKNLSLLKKLTMKNLGEVKNDQAAFEGVNLKAKEQLRVLSLDWSGSDDVVYSENAQEKLEPASTLEQLTIESYGGVKFPNCFPHLEKLVVVVIGRCKKCEHLPPLSRLRCLKTLSILWCGNLRYMEDERSDNGIFYPSLKDLNLYFCKSLERWWKNETTSTETTHFPCLSKLSITRSPKLTSMPLFPNLDEELELVHTCIKPLQQTLKMDQVSASTVSSSSSSSLQPTSSVVHPLSKLKKLRIVSPESELSPQEMITEDLASVIRGMRQLSCLQTLELKCPGLKGKCENKEGAHWPDISHIPNIIVDGKIVQEEGCYKSNDYPFPANFYHHLPQIYPMNDENPDACVIM